MPDNKQSLLSIPDLAQMLNVSSCTIRRMIRRGEMPVIRVGGQWRFKRDSIEKWLEKNTREEASDQSA